MYDIETTEDAYAAYDDTINEQEWPTVAGMEFAPSDILRELDPIAYRCGFNDWADAEGIDVDDLEGTFYRH